MKFKEWMYKKNNHWDNTTNKTILDEILSDIIQYIIKNDELYFKYELDVFRINFYIFAYTQKVEEYEYSEDYEYFNMKYNKSKMKRSPTSIGCNNRLASCEIIAARSDQKECWTLADARTSNRMSPTRNTSSLGPAT